MRKSRSSSGFSSTTAAPAGEQSSPRAPDSRRDEPAGSGRASPAFATGTDSRPIRVLFVNDHLGYASGAIHGATTYFLTVLTGFEPRKVEPRLCILRDRHPAAERLEAACVTPIFLGRSKWDPRAVLDLVRVVREQDIDILHLSGHKAMLLGRLAARITGRPAILHLHDADRLEPYMRSLQRRLAAWTEVALAVSEPVRRVAIEEFGLAPERVEVVPNPVRLETLAHPSPGARGRIRRELGLAEAAPVVGVIGRLIPGKGQAHLIGAMPALRARCRDAALVVAGEGPTRGDCQALAERLGLGAAVRFTGHREDIPDLLAALDVVVVPSVCTEGFGYAALEAIAAGRPVVAFASGGLCEVVPHQKAGLLVPPGDIGGLARAIGDILEDPKLARALARGGRVYARRFGVQAHVRRLEELYAAQVASRRRPGPVAGMRGGYRPAAGGILRPNA